MRGPLRPSQKHQMCIKSPGGHKWSKTLMDTMASAPEPMDCATRRQSFRDITNCVVGVKRAKLSCAQIISMSMHKFKQCNKITSCAGLQRQTGGNGPQNVSPRVLSPDQPMAPCQKRTQLNKINKLEQKHENTGIELHVVPQTRRKRK